MDQPWVDDNVDSDHQDYNDYNEYQDNNDDFHDDFDYNCGHHNMAIMMIMIIVMGIYE